MKKILGIILIAVLSGYIILSFIYAVDGYPGFVQDAVCFLPTTYFINHYHQLINPFYDAGLDPVKHRFLFYPPLFPYVIAYILRILPDHTNNIQIALTVIDSINILLLLFSIYIYAKKKKIQGSTYLYLFLIFWLLGLFSFYGISDGRPEILCRFFITLFIINNLLRNKKYYNLIDGLLIGLNLITSPISAFYLIIIKAGLLFYRKEFNVKSIVLSLAGFSFIILCFLLLYPYHISELIHTMQQHSKNVILNRSEENPIKNLFKYYILNPYNPLGIFTIFTSLGYVFYQLFKKRDVICIIVFLLFIGVMSYFCFRNMGLVYNMFVLTPITFFILFVIFTNSIFKISNPFFKIMPVIIVLLLLINSVGYIRKTLLYFSTEKNKFSYTDFRREFIKVLNVSDKSKKIVMTYSLWPYCLDKYENVVFRTTQSDPDSDTQYIIVQQLYSGQLQPASKKDFEVVDNKFIQDHPKLGKLPLGNVIPWFQIAVYKRNKY